MMQAVLILGILIPHYDALTIFQPLPWEDTWKELVIEDFHAVNHKEAFEGWKRAFGKTYYDEEENKNRFLMWLDNWFQINKHNMESTTHTLKMNEFSDLSNDEFKKYIHGSTELCVKASNTKHNIQMNREVHNTSAANATVPSAWDWSNVNGSSWLTAVKNQGKCGGCWAFSAVGAIESAYVIKNFYQKKQSVPDPIPSLSEQQLIDCSKSYGNNGCHGGLMDDAFQYVEHVGGLCTEQEYPYVGKDSTCKESSCGTLHDAIISHKDVSTDDESALQSAVSQHPVSIAIQADQFSFRFYHGGVLHAKCGDRLDHGVLLVGYGYDQEADLDYWKVKNSWGESWGESGFVRICRNCNQDGDDGECGILMSPSFPVAKGD